MNGTMIEPEQIVKWYRDDYVRLEECTGWCEAYCEQTNMMPVFALSISYVMLSICQLDIVKKSSWYRAIRITSSILFAVTIVWYGLFRDMTLW